MVRLPGAAYLDSSALAKIYLPEQESADLNAALLGHRALLVSDLAITEVVSALCRRCRAGEVRPAVPGKVHRQILAHVEQGFFMRVELTSPVHRQAESRLLRASAGPILRGMDALHLALALSAGAVTMVAFDQRLRAAAAAAGLALWPPDHQL